MSLNIPRKRLFAGLLVLISVALLAGCGGDGDTLTVYSGRQSSLVQPILEAFAEEQGIPIAVRYASTSGIVALLLEEGDRTPADVVFLQDAGALGALSKEGKLAPLPDDILDRVDERFRSPKGEWVGVSGRARTVIYNTSTIDPERDLPASILDFTEPTWKGRIGWAPTNGSFQSFVTALRVQLGEDAAREWLEGIRGNDPRVYPNNISIVQAAARGEIDVGFVNHYYLHRFLAEEGADFGARNYYIGGGDPGALVNVAGMAVINASDQRQTAEQFVAWMLGAEAQEYFASETKEYPLASGIAPLPALLPLEQLDPPNIDLSDLSDLEGTLRLLRETGVIP